MESHPFIICSVNRSCYGIEAFAVQEIFFLPELTPVAEAPPDIVGMLNLRGEIVPVIDLQIRLGQQAQEYKITDSVVILNCDGFRIGVIVTQVHEVQSISTADIKSNQFYGGEDGKLNGSSITLASQRNASAAHFVFGIAQVGENLVMLLNYQNLLQYTLRLKEKSADNFNFTQFNQSDRAANGVSNLVFCPNATPEERVIFRDRAENLLQAAENEDFTGLIPVAVIGLNGEYFGLELEAVREFTDIGKITPIPCCPPHIIGNINLRGEIVTLVDIRGLLNLPLATASKVPKAMVIRIDDLVAGLTVDNVFDVMYLNPSQIMPIPAAAHSMNDEYIRGTAIYREKMMSILELPKILMNGGLNVDEEV